MDRAQKKALQKCHLELLDSLNPEDRVVDHLYSDGILSSDEKAKILLPALVKEKARELLEVIPRKGADAWESFITSLRKSEGEAHVELAGKLETMLAQVQAGRNPRPDRQADTDGSGPSRLQYNVTSPDWLGVGGSGSSSSGGDGSQLSVRVNLDDNREVYKMSSQPRGLAYVINNKNFVASSGMPKRNGTDVDMKALDKLWTSMGFKVQVFKDQGGKDMRDQLGQLAKLDHSGRDCLIVSILSHGVEGKLYGSDGDLVPVDELLDLFHNDVVHKSLVGKPKLFFLQACRGDYFDKGTDMADGDGQQSIEKKMLDDNADTTIDGKSIPSASDMFIGYATIPGFVSWRNSERGSWYVQYIIKTFKECAEKDHLVDMMVKVNQGVALEFEASGHNKQVPSPIVRLTKKLYFRPGYFQR